MLYLIRTDGSMQWVELPSELGLAAAREYGADLTVLDWRPSDWRAREPEVGLALRHGVAARAGVVVAGSLIALLERPRALRAARDAAKGSDTAIAGKNLAMDRLVPGWIASGRRVEAVIDRAADEAIEREIARIEDLLTAPLDPALVRHWQLLGGAVPDFR